jgi:cobalt-zinc-cadmium efflux system outer membrane protein
MGEGKDLPSVERRERRGKRRFVGAILCGCALLTLMCSLASADEQLPESVTLPEALDLLEQQNPDTLAARLQIAQAEAERLMARRYANPTLSVDTSDIPVGRTTPPGLSVGQTIGAAVRLDQPLVLWGKRRLRIEGAEVGVAAAKGQERDVLRQLRSAVKDAFYGVLHDARLFEFTSANRERYQKIVELNERRFRSGDISEVEFRKIELENLKRLTEAEEARRSLAGRRQLLGRLIGSGQAVQATGKLSAPDVEVDDAQALNLAMENRPDLLALQRTRDQAEIALTLARRERYPDVTVGLDYTHSQFVISGDNRNSLGLGFSLPLPLLNQNQAEIAKAEIGVRQAETDLKRLRLDIAQEVRDAAEGYQSVRRLWHTFESGYLDHAKLTVDAAETSYRIGGASLLELLDAERTYTSTQTDYLDTVFAARSSFNALEKAVGKDLTNE